MPEYINQPLELEIQWLKELIQAIRTIRSEMLISPAKHLTLLIKPTSNRCNIYIEKYRYLLITICKLNQMHFLLPEETIPISATIMLKDDEFFIPMAGIIDKDAELTRLNREIDKCNNDIIRAKNKLHNDNFVHKAPQAIIDKEKLKFSQATTYLSKLLHHQAKIESIE